MEVIENKAPEKDSEIKWKDISMEVVAEMKGVHDKTNLHYQEELDETSKEWEVKEEELQKEMSIELEKEEMTKEELSKEKGAVVHKQLKEITKRSIAEVGESVHEALAKMKENGVLTTLPNVISKTAEIKKEKNIEKTEIQNDEADVPEEKEITRRTIDFSILQKRKEELEAKKMAKMAEKMAEKMVKEKTATPVDKEPSDSVQNLLKELISVVKESKLSSTIVNHNYYHYYASNNK